MNPNSQRDLGAEIIAAQAERNKREARHDAKLSRNPVTIDSTPDDYKARYADMLTRYDIAMELLDHALQIAYDGSRTNRLAHMDVKELQARYEKLRDSE